MYKIIGTDGKQYGPVNADMIRRWQAENRVNAQTLMQMEGAVEWKPLSAFPEFAGGTQAVPPTILPPPPVAASRASNKIPAGICGILLGGFGVHKFILGYQQEGIILLAVSLVAWVITFITCGIGAPLVFIPGLIGIVEGIIYLTKSDEDFVNTYIVNKKPWF